MKVKKILFIAVLFFICVWLYSLLKCEILTIMHKEEFIGLEQQTNMLDISGNLKVLNYSSDYARIYYVDNEGGDVIEFQKNNNWELTYWSTIWSDTGSASGVIWPYWWHFIYGGI